MTITVFNGTKRKRERERTTVKVILFSCCTFIGNSFEKFLTN